MQTLMAKDSSLSSQFNNFRFHNRTGSGPYWFKDKIAADFPQGPDVSYDIKYITEALQDSVSPAMYFLPQLDNLNINSIYINPKDTRSSQLYPTLAHEGYPGHLYQTTYLRILTRTLSAIWLHRTVMWKAGLPTVSFFLFVCRHRKPPAQHACTGKLRHNSMSVCKMWPRN